MCKYSLKIVELSIENKIINIFSIQFFYLFFPFLSVVIMELCFLENCFIVSFSHQLARLIELLFLPRLVKRRVFQFEVNDVSAFAADYLFIPQFKLQSNQLILYLTALLVNWSLINCLYCTINLIENDTSVLLTRREKI